MKRKTESTSATSSASTPATRTRTPKPVSAAAQALLLTATADVAAAKAKIKEAKSLGKVIECIGTLGTWGLGEVEKSVAARKNVLTPLVGGAEAYTHAGTVTNAD